MRWANFIRAGVRLTESVRLDVIIIRDEYRQAVPNHGALRAYGHCVIFTVRMKD